ncbi:MULTISPECIES: TrkH family potassium uptake protein [unclassified Acutalibacter]|jgi:trk system potassium uptake protein TrkH|uniref:TrkH family potassium uptake protein n=1 Tax=unclassified Acutalibacter TaxID=2620728 RepID=UPI001411D27E|nr:MULTISPECIES: TrkH family potassium uptake protein [unclassified Acutalibacter]MCI9226093.1 TrkH family potassium uptake protein [Acutalibacter sp.]NBJ89823.1 TrkH family potassium uptake protein [Acutalibacter sp. 1XD8-36]
MNYRMILRLICYILRVEAVCLLPSLGISFFQGETGSVIGVAATIVLSAVLSLSSFLLPPSDRQISAREGFLSVALCWVVVSLIGALPFCLSGAVPSYIDCLFETVSGFTTTGASILSDIEALPMGLLYWRSFTHWLGGMGVLVFLLAVIPMGKGKNSLLHVMRAESPGPQVDKLVPKLQDSAKILYAIYIGLTILQIVLLLLGGMPVFDSVTTAFGTAGTGGFGIKADSLMGYSHYLQGVCTVFMALFGVNFSIFYLLLLRQFMKVLKNQEMLLYLGIMIGSILVIAFDILPQYVNMGEALHQAAFQVSSVMTTTGFATADFNEWPALSKTLLVLLMFVGACAGSTGGGMKVARVLLLMKAGRRSVKRMLRPRSVSQVHMDGGTVSEEVIQNTYSYLALYMGIMVLSVFLIALDEFSLETNATAVIACLNNIGPGLDMVGPMGNYAAFSWHSKLVLTFDMLAGRLELFPMIMLFVPLAWKRT